MAAKFFKVRSGWVELQNVVIGFIAYAEKVQNKCHVRWSKN
jgi:hypothetical protein